MSVFVISVCFTLDVLLLLLLLVWLLLLLWLWCPLTTVDNLLLFVYESVGLGDLWPFVSTATAPFDFSCFCSDKCLFLVGCSRGVSIWGDKGAGGARGNEGGGPWGTSASARFFSCTAGAGVVGIAGSGSSGVDFTLDDDGLLPLTLWLWNEI